MASTYSFTSFGRRMSGRLVTDDGFHAVVQARNPYGSHNLLLVDMASGEAIRHGTAVVVGAVCSWMSDRAYRRVRKFLAARGIAREWVVSHG